jgi:hypothetical protein
LSQKEYIQSCLQLDLMGFKTSIEEQAPNY